MSHLSPPTLIYSEQKAILRSTACNPRDHLIYSLALGTGLRLTEIVGLSVGDVYIIDDRTFRTRLRIRAEIAKGGRKGDVFLPDALMGKLRKFWAHKARRREGLRPHDPLLCSQSRVRISKRRVQFAFRTWQVKAGLDRLHPFHALRHTARSCL
jgi:integrase/recombinase XerC